MTSNLSGYTGFSACGSKSYIPYSPEKSQTSAQISYLCSKQAQASAADTCATILSTVATMTRSTAVAEPVKSEVCML